MKVKSTTQPIISIAVIEDDPIRLIGLRSILDQVSGFHVTAASTSDIATNQSVDIAIVRNHSVMKFTETMSALRVVRPDLRVVVIGTGTDDETVLNAIVCGAKGYVDEASSRLDLAQAIHSVYHGLVWVPRRVMSLFIERSGGLLGRNPQPGSSGLITSRERQVLGMLIEGRSNKEIGGPLGIEERTVKAHLSKLMSKVGVKNRVALSIHAVNHSLVSAH